MKVSDEILDIAMQIALYDGLSKVNKELYTGRFRAALEAVFDHIADASKVIDKQVIKDFVDMMEREMEILHEYQAEAANSDKRLWDEQIKAIRDLESTPEYEVLKASITPSSEDSTQLKHPVEGDDIIYNTFPNNTNKSDDGWIAHAGGSIPGCPSNVNIIAKLRNGTETAEGRAGAFDWSWKDTMSKTDIIAYRIIEEKEPKK